jgi:GlpG protein
MREIGRIGRAEAVIFGDYLVVHGIENELEVARDGRTAIWVLREDRVKESRELFTRFQAAPLDGSWREGATKARELREHTAAEDAKRDAQIRTPASDWRQRRQAWLTIALVAASVTVTLLCNFGQDRAQFSIFAFNAFSADGQELNGHFSSIAQGQLWRLVTPIFIHLSTMHLLCNSMGLVLYGQMVEVRQGRAALAVMVAALAVITNCGQYLASGPTFGGMSGVLYGLFGYVWLRSLLERSSGYYVSRGNALLMVSWFLICLSGRVGPIGNVAHGFGLVLGAAWGALSVRSVRQRLLAVFGR